MTVVTCGRSSMDDRVEASLQANRQHQGFQTNGGCGQDFDLDSLIHHMKVYRCVECARWLCKPCIAAHFEESRHDKEATTPQPAVPHGQHDGRQ